MVFHPMQRGVREYQVPFAVERLDGLAAMREAQRRRRSVHLVASAGGVRRGRRGDRIHAARTRKRRHRDLHEEQRGDPREGGETA